MLKAATWPLTLRFRRFTRRHKGSADNTQAAAAAAAGDASGGSNKSELGGAEEGGSEGSHQHLPWVLDINAPLTEAEVEAALRFDNTEAGDQVFDGRGSGGSDFGDGTVRGGVW